MADLVKLLNVKLAIKDVCNSLDGSKPYIDEAIDTLMQISEDITHVMINLEKYDK